ncbi:hypothetical protein BC828DRAFT_409673 [Blastocladiella britannica]|nr:hypothetical protein BC828DRAFT_409673 [Blastocladiella britannica]
MLLPAGMIVELIGSTVVALRMTHSAHWYLTALLTLISSLIVWMAKVTVGMLPMRALLHEQWLVPFLSPDSLECTVTADELGYFLECCDAQDGVANTAGGTTTLYTCLWLGGIVPEGWIRDWTDACEYKAALLLAVVTTPST